MKHTFRKLLSLVLALATIGTLFTTAIAAKTDVLTLESNMEEGFVTVNALSGTHFFVSPTVTTSAGADVSNNYEFTYRWLLNEKNVSVSNYYMFPANMDPESYTLICTVTATHKTDRTVKSAHITWYPTIERSQNIELTIAQNIGNFYFDNSSTQNGASVYSEIYNTLGLTSSSNTEEYIVSFVPNSSLIAVFNGESSCTLKELDKIYLSVLSSGTWITHYSVSHKSNVVLSGTLTIKIEPYIALDNVYSVAPGEDAVITADDIISFWMNATGNYSTLQYVYVTGFSGMNGTLCYDHSFGENGHTSAFSLIMYASPVGSTQKPIADISFIPTKISNKYPTGTLTVSISAVGTDENKKSITVNGNFVIFYTNNDPDTIEYECTGTNIMLDGDDFDDVYRAVTGKNTATPSYSIRFLDLPSYGTLYRGYVFDEYSHNGGTPITSSNISVLTFSSASTGENSLDKLCYIPTSYVAGGETIRYVAYSGNQILYVGTVKFTSHEFVVTYNTNSAFNFSSLDFFTNDSPLLNAQFVVFGNPPTGTLYKDYANGVRVQRYDYFSHNTSYGVNLLDNITYVPKEDFVGVVEIPFAGYALTGGAVSGKVRIFVVRDFFEDVDPNNWAAPFINRLYATGVVQGTSTTTFSPDSYMTYGAALKMILLAANYPKQSETSGPHWASNYLTLAYRKGIVNNTNVDLDAPVDRETIAVIAAKALGMSAATSVNTGIIAPTDSNNGYVYALYNAGILNGSFEKGKNYFHGSEYITRAHVAKIICKILDYNY